MYVYDAQLYTYVYLVYDWVERVDDLNSNLTVKCTVYRVYMKRS